MTAVAETVTSLFGASVALSTAVIVTVPVLSVSPAATVSTLLSPTVKSSAVAPVPGAADTVIVVALVDVRFSLAVTFVALPGPLSSIIAGVSTSVTSGGPSSSRITSVTDDGPVIP